MISQTYLVIIAFLLFSIFFDSSRFHIFNENFLDIFGLLLYLNDTYFFSSWKEKEIFLRKLFTFIFQNCRVIRKCPVRHMHKIYGRLRLACTFIKSNQHDFLEYGAKRLHAVAGETEALLVALVNRHVFMWRSPMIVWLSRSGEGRVGPEKRNEETSLQTDFDATVGQCVNVNMALFWIWCRVHR